MNAADLLDQYKHAKGFTSDYQAAAALGITAQTISGWRKRGGGMETGLVLAIAEEIGLEPMQTLLEMELPRARSEMARTALLRILQRCAGCIGPLVVAAALIGHSPNAEAGINAHKSLNPIYIMRLKIQSVSWLPEALNRPSPGLVMPVPRHP